jgi:hypothetical protein
MKTKLTINAHHMTKPSLVDRRLHIRNRFQAVFVGRENGFVCAEKGFVRRVPRKPLHGIESALPKRKDDRRSREVRRSSFGGMRLGVGRALDRPTPKAQFYMHIPGRRSPHGGTSFVDANDLPISLAAKLDFAGPSVEALNAYRR